LILDVQVGEWGALKTRYLPPTRGMVGFKKPLPAPYNKATYFITY